MSKNFLIQKKNSLYNLEYALYGDDNVKSFIKGVKGYNKPKNTGLKSIIPKSTLNPNPKPNNVFNIRNPATTEEVEEEVEELGEITPVYNDNRTISWVDSNSNISKIYQQIWDLLKPEYKAVLVRDTSWMIKTMNSFVEFAKLKIEKKLPYGANRQFVHPDGLLLPPIKISDGNYDYGNSFYNSYLNGDANGIWLTFLPRSPDGSYQHYLNALASIIGSLVKFTTN